MLDAVSTGLHPSAVVAQLARRAKWVPLVLGLEKYAEFADVVVQRLNAVQKAAWTIYLNASNDNARVGALRTVLEAWRFTAASFRRGTLLSVWIGWRSGGRSKRICAEGCDSEHSRSN